MAPPAHPHEYRCGPEGARITGPDIVESGAPCNGIRAVNPQNTRKGIHSVQNSNFSIPPIIELCYTYSAPIPKYIFNKDYPTNPKTFGEKLRQIRLDAGLQIREFAQNISSAEETVINWEIRNIFPSSQQFKKMINYFDANPQESFRRSRLMELYFSNIEYYPKNPKSFGEKLRASRMQHFMSIKKLASILGVDPCTVAGWEKKDKKPDRKSIDNISLILDIQL